MATSRNGQADTHLSRVLRGYAEAGNAHDIDAMISSFAAGCKFYSSTGPEISGTRYSGSEEVRESLRLVLRTCPDGQWRNLRYFVSEDRGVIEWTFTGTTPGGSTIEVNGCDLITFNDGKISIKDSYRKQRNAS